MVRELAEKYFLKDFGQEGEVWHWSVVFQDLGVKSCFLLLLLLLFFFMRGFTIANLKADGKRPECSQGLYRTQVTSRQESDSSAHLDKRSKQHQVCSNSRFDLHCPKALYSSVFFNTRRSRALLTLRLLSREASLYASAD